MICAPGDDEPSTLSQSVYTIYQDIFLDRALTDEQHDGFMADKSERVKGGRLVLQVT
jgi:hypothetical protein